MSGADTELALVALAAMLSPTTVSFSLLALVLSERPLRTGFWFYLGALSAMLVVGVAAAFVLGDAAAGPRPGRAEAVGRRPRRRSRRPDRPVRAPTRAPGARSRPGGADDRE